MFQQIIDDHTRALEALNTIKPDITQVAEILTTAIGKGHKIVICGNGGSAADAHHFAGELVGRFLKERRPWPVMALGSNVVAATAMANDYAFKKAYSRELRGFGQPGDAFIGISTSGNSENIICAAKTAKQIGMKTIGLLGAGGGSICDQVDMAIVVLSNQTPRIQEMHILILHYWAAFIENTLVNAGH